MHSLCVIWYDSLYLLYFNRLQLMVYSFHRILSSSLIIGGNFQHFFDLTQMIYLLAIAKIDELQKRNMLSLIMKMIGKMFGNSSNNQWWMHFGYNDGDRNGSHLRLLYTWFYHLCSHIFTESFIISLWYLNVKLSVCQIKTKNFPHPCRRESSTWYIFTIFLSCIKISRH